MITMFNKFDNGWSALIVLGKDLEGNVVAHVTQIDSTGILIPEETGVCPTLESLASVIQEIEQQDA